MSDDMSDETTPIVCVFCGCAEFCWDEKTGLMYCDKCGAPLVINGVHQNIYEDEE